MVILPYGGNLVNKIVSESELATRLSGIKESIFILPHDLINLYNIAVGCYSPLKGFMTSAEYESVIQSNKLPTGLNWTIPILLHVESYPRETKIALRSQEDGVAIAILYIESVFEIDKAIFCQQVFNTTDSNHPGVRQTMEKADICIGGEIFLNKSRIENLRYLRIPAENRKWIKQTNKETFTAFSTRNICHIGHEYLHGLALETTDVLGINIITGAEIKGNFLPDVIFDTYEHLLFKFYPEGKVFLNNLRLPPIYGGPKEAFLQAIILQNYGFTHFIIGRDHAGIGEYYPKYGSQQIFKELKSLDIRILSFTEPRLCKVCRRVTTERSCRHNNDSIVFLNGSNVRRYLLEKRYGELNMIINSELQQFLTKMIEERPETIFL